MKKNFTGWGFLEAKDNAGAENNDENIAHSFARIFETVDGKKVLAHLEAITIGRLLPTDISDAELRHHEGKRSLFFHIKSMIRNGQNN